MSVFHSVGNFQNIARPVPSRTHPLNLRTAKRLDIPYNKLGIFARQYETNQTLVGLPIFAVAELGPLESISGTHPPKSQTKPDIVIKVRDVAITEPPKSHVPLGMLSTDHAGYASYDLGILHSDSVLVSLQKDGILSPHSSEGIEPTGTVILRRLWILPFGDGDLAVDALASADIGPDYLMLRLALDNTQLQDRELKLSARPSMQNPGILDYRMSPGSFTVSSSVLVGVDGNCESFLPTNLATQTFRFYQVARIRGASRKGSHAVKPGSRAVESLYRLGYIFQYSTEWFPVGHSLGTLAYSLPLAPGEIVKVSIVDWARSDTADRSEDTGFSENLQHRQLRDRSISENVSAMLDEWQRGGSVMGGVAASGGGTMGAASVGAAASLGGAYTTSSGTRHLTTDTAQQVADAFQQSTSAMRELRSTVVIHDTQKEDSTAHTRVVANYNHGHALTILYYEVLRHYRVVTRLTSSRLALLIDYTSRAPSLRDDNYLIANRDILQPLVDQGLAGSFDAVARAAPGIASFNAAYQAWDLLPYPGDVEFSRFILEIQTSNQNLSGTDADIRIWLNRMDLSTVYFTMANPSGQSDSTIFDLADQNVFESGDVDVFECRLQGNMKIRWKSIRSFAVNNDGSGPAPDWRPQHFKITGITDTAQQVVIYDAEYGREIGGDQTCPEIFVVQPPAKNGEPKRDDFVTAADWTATKRLKDYLEQHQYDICRALWLNENVNARANVFDHMRVGTESMLDLIENKAIEISGNWVAFPVASGEGDHSAVAFLQAHFGIPSIAKEGDGAEDTYVEQLLSLPTRGVFAEARLGSCNANELIDDKRFWDWQKSPIPYQAPDIAPASTDSRDHGQPSGLAPSNFPQSVVNLVSPQALPDPTGLKAALEAISTPNIFRDMSAAKEVGSLLEKLSDNATKMAAGAMQQGSKDQLLKTIRDAPELSSDQKSKLVGDLLGNEVNATKRAGGDNAGATGTPSEASGTSGGTSSAPGGTPGSGSPKGHDSSDPGQPTESPPKQDGTPKQDGPPKTTSPPVPSKPTKPTPTPARGLQFKLIFHGAKTEQEVLLGYVDITIEPSGTGLRPDDSTDRYVPGKTIGPAPAVPAYLKARHWDSVPIKMNSIMLDSESIRGPGQVALQVQFNEETLQSDSVYAAAYKALDATTPIGKPIFSSGFLMFNNAVAYNLPTVGNTVVLDVKPEVKDISVTINQSSNVEQTIGGKIAASWKVLSGEITDQQKDATGKVVSATLNYQVVTGGLIIKQLQ